MCVCASPPPPRLKENLMEVLARTNTENLMQTAQDFDIDMDSAADKAIRLIDKIIYGEKVCTLSGGLGSWGGSGGSAPGAAGERVSRLG